MQVKTKEMWASDEGPVMFRRMSEITKFSHQKVVIAWLREDTFLSILKGAIINLIFFLEWLPLWWHLVPKMVYKRPKRLRQNARIPLNQSLPRWSHGLKKSPFNLLEKVRPPLQYNFWAYKLAKYAQTHPPSWSHVLEKLRFLSFGRDATTPILAFNMHPWPHSISILVI